MLACAFASALNDFVFGNLNVFKNGRFMYRRPELGVSSLWGFLELQLGSVLGSPCFPFGLH